MFPSGSSNHQAFDSDSKKEEWLQSSTYKRALQNNLKEKDYLLGSNSFCKESEKYYKDNQLLHCDSKKNAVPYQAPITTDKDAKNKIFLEDFPDLELDDAFRIDRSNNREIYRHGCIYEKHVSKYKSKRKTNIIGFKNLQLCDLADCDASNIKKLAKKSRYFSKSSKAVIFGAAVKITPQPHQTENEIIISLPVYTVPESSNPNSHCDEVLTVCENLNRLVYDKPNDLSAWLELIDLQAKDASFLYIENPQTTKDTADDIAKRPANEILVILKKQLSIIDRALSANPGCLTLKFMYSRLNEFAAELEAQGASKSTSLATFQPEKISRDWAQFAFTYPQLVIVWRGHIAHLMGRYSSLGSNLGVGNGLFSRIDSVYKRGLGSLSGIISGRILSHRPQPDTVEHTTDFVSDYCHWLVQAGHAERALAVWQAVIEYNCFCPKDLLSVSHEQRMLEMELFWSSGAARFGQPDSQHWSGWYRNRNRKSDKSKSKDSKTSRKSKKSSVLLSIINEIPSDASSEEIQTLWSDVTKKLKAISDACEDALINCTTETMIDEQSSAAEFDVIPSVLSSATVADQWVRRGPAPSLAGHAPIGKSRAVLYRRGKAWVGLERAREAVGWLPSDALTSDPNSAEDEDPERMVLFDDIKGCIIDLWKFDQVPSSTAEICQRAFLQQRILLLCLEFLGAYNEEVAAQYKFPADIRLAHDLTLIGPLQRQGLSPLSSANKASVDSDPTNSEKPNSQLSSEHLDVWVRARRCFIDAALIQMSNHPSWWDPVSIENWTVVLGKLRFTIASERLCSAIRSRNYSPKDAISVWRHCGRTIMSQGKNKNMLSLWRIYAHGFWLIHCEFVAIEPGTFETTDCPLQECRHIFDTALKMYPIPSELGPSTSDMNEIVKFYQSILTPRLELLQAYLDIELGVSPGAGGCKFEYRDEPRALYLLTHGALGGQYDPIDPLAKSNLPTTLVKTNFRFGKRMETIWTLLVSLSEQFDTMPYSANLLIGLAESVPILSYLSFMFDLLTTGPQNLSNSFSSLIPVLLRIDHLVDKYMKSEEDKQLGIRRTTGWSAEENSSNSSDQTKLVFRNRMCLRKFISLVVGGLTAFCVLRQQNRQSLLNEMFDRLSDCTKHDRTVRLNDLIFPSQWTFLIPPRVALEQNMLPLSLANASSCHGLLPPLFLSQFIQQLNSFCQSVKEFVSQSIVHQTVTGSRLSSRLQPKNQSNSSVTNSTMFDTSILMGTQLELYAGSLPGALSLFILSLELERWTILLAGISSQHIQGCVSTSDQRVRNAFERALQFSPIVTPMLAPNGSLIHVALAASNPSFWAAHLRLVIWRAYMAFGWMAGSTATQTSLASIGTNMDPRQRRQAVKAVFYRAIEDVPWAKVLYTDLVRYCPEDVEEVVDLLSERELRLRTPLEEVDLLLSAKPLP